MPTPTQTGYTFDGWYTGAGGTGSLITGTTAVATASNHTLYAKWTIEQHTVTFDAEGGSGVNAITQNYNTQVSAPTAPTRNGYTFVGWYDGDNGTGNAVAFPYTLTADKTVYANYRINVTVTPAAPNVTVDDSANRIVGANSIMEYSKDGGNTWIGYLTSSEPTFTGTVTVLIRVAASGGNLVGLTTTLNFTTNYVAPYYPPATTDNTANTGDTSVKEEVRQVDINAGNEKGTGSGTVATVDIVRKVGDDKKIDAVVLDEAKTEEVLQKVIEQKQDIVQIVIDEIEDDQADLVNVTVNHASMNQLSESNIALEIKTEEIFEQPCSLCTA